MQPQTSPLKFIVCHNIVKGFVWYKMDQYQTDSVNKFNWIEYTTFGSLLSLSVMIGIYYGCIKGNQNTVSEYMLGGKRMKVFPIAMSLVASHISGVTLLGYPAEIYEFGTQFVMQIVGTYALIYITNTFYLPVFYDLQLTSVFEYLELRFSKVVRKFCSLLYAFALVLYIPVVIYIPALAFNQVTGADIHMVTPLISFLCIFYTTIGGLKAVVWTDTVQGLFSMGVTIVVVILGVIHVGGLRAVYDANARSDRWEFFNFNPNPLARMNFWTAFLGSLFQWVVVLTVHPGSTQRFISLPSMKAAKRSVVWFAIGASIMTITSSFAGVVMYAHYEGCDPLTIKTEVHKSGELLPHYVQEIASYYPGLTGLFISGLVSIALSFMSAGLNTVAGVLYEDFIDNFMPENTTEWLASYVMKMTVIFVGSICVLLVYVIENFGTITQLAFSLGGTQYGATFAAFALGLFFPWANSKGVISGIVSSVACMSWILIGTQTAMLKKELVYVGKNTSIDRCAGDLNITIDRSYLNLTEVANGVFIAPHLNPMYAISFYLYTPVGALIGISVGLLVSLLTGGNDLKKMNPKFITPVLRKYLIRSNDVKVNDVSLAII